ncbi:YycH family regulatory protein [Ureibacillus chungkukjangi]|uniref:Regulatory protein YycH of two-component signal transduction system YycFG n=1 Tax=Ureibacillus chungkukjangi TaxID=1202712 RepID=A0A318TSN8_9BACL|nr:two-component system activity regulator YycH [Ureibacillus chungkukjangi]MCM3387586.1 two-component system activity regulator YycH [Ureibacillus chungkukjangi]PYF07861.1 regulatory protein YycH of two-component signal transduction system YycFG [Ureibacillus chungkukjangi]
MKHVEQIKSFVLFLLVFLSLILTFTIWTYTPDYQDIEDPQVEQITLGDKKDIQEIFKPYRILIHENGGFLGSTAPTAIDTLMDAIKDLDATELRFIQSNLSEEKLNSMIHSENQMTLFFPAEVPINAFDSVLQFTQSELPEIAFSHILIDWSNIEETNTLQFSFISKEKQTLYTTVVGVGQSEFNSTYMKTVQKTVPYEEIVRANELSLYVPSNAVDLVQYTYYIDEISTEVFKDILFEDTNIVQKNFDNTTYTDGMAMMTYDSGSKTINYVYPASESMVEIKHSDLVHDSYDFVNDHGGLTGDYRYSYNNIPKHVIEYQLYLQGLPVFSSVTSTRIAVTWGANQVFEYKRPYYLFIASESSTRQLPSGVDMVKTLQTLKDIDDLVLGYYLTPDPQKAKVYTLEPSWFVIREGSWARLTPEPAGGAQYGLE